MMRRILSLIALLVLSIHSYGAPLPSAALQDASARRALNPDGIAAIEAYSRKIDGYVQRNSKRARIFANMASGSADNGPGKWLEFKNEKEREQADTGDNLNENAYVWTKDAMIVGANFTFQSPSRDWAHFVMYYYRSDGTLAKIASTLNTFYGNMTVKRTILYDRSGKVLRTSTRHLDLNTQKPKKPKKGEFYDEVPPVYAKVSKLPFYDLLNKH